MVIQVTREHIEKGEKLCQTSCAISLALQNYGQHGLCVGTRGIYPRKSHGRDFYYPPIVKHTEHVRDFIGNFDWGSLDGVDVSPIEFRLSAECFME